MNSPLLVFLDSTTYVSRDFLRVLFCDRSLDGVVNRTLTLLSYRTSNCVVDCLVSCLANRSLDSVSFGSHFLLFNTSCYRNLHFVVNSLIDCSITSDFLLFVDHAFHSFHHCVVASATIRWCSCGNCVVARATTTLAPAEAGWHHGCGKCCRGQQTSYQFHRNFSKKLTFQNLEVASGLVIQSPCRSFFSPLWARNNLSRACWFRGGQRHSSRSVKCERLLLTFPYSAV